jgi:transcriptional regulator with XRE-family HTH domain
LGWSAEDLAERAGLHRATIQRLERRKGAVRAHTATLDAVLTVFDAVGIEFISENGTVGVVHNIDAISHDPSE